ncbi:acetate kinase [Marinobacter salinisoli]|uniref:Acetate kinase n=1 Tax=Marinobacter salinisoli TaxID=2769486 RepID=A0ABX7MP68_9GAMM|nr:acetate kinase [Marinobacter salinisoli]QSP94081.1 acetate kinase [Marinobacter salinisoli]
MEPTTLVVNCGSSSLKLALFDRKDQKLATVLVERLNTPHAVARIQGLETQITIPAEGGYEAALQAVLAALKEEGLMTSDPTAVGHRVVHGGETFREAVLVDDDVLESIQACSGLAPLHNPVNLAGIEAMRKLYPTVPQIAVFDTAFHQTLPPRAYRYALPDHYYRQWAVRRYGFHGTSHYYMTREAARRLDRTPATTSLISAHLGNGCSITAIRDGNSVDTSMGLTPLEGLVMGTRSGDVDPGLFDYLSTKGITANQLSKVLNQESGLLGLSGQTNDMRTLCDLADHGHEPSRLAVDVFCFRLAKYIGAMMASLSQLDALVFTGGIGENSSRIRQQTCSHLGLLGFDLDAELNHAHGGFSDGIISNPDSRFPVIVIPTNEELVIANEATRLAGSPMARDGAQ